MSMNFRRYEPWEDDEYFDLVEFYKMCIVLRFSPEYIDSMSQKEIAAAIEAYNDVAKERSRG